MALRFLAREILSIVNEAWEAARVLSERLPPIPESEVLGVKFFGDEERKLLRSFEKDNDGFFFQSVSCS